VKKQFFTRVSTSAAQNDSDNLLLQSDNLNTVWEFLTFPTKY